jgi:hypothetical protein
VVSTNRNGELGDVELVGERDELRNRAGDELPHDEISLRGSKRQTVLYSSTKADPPAECQTRSNIEATDQQGQRRQRQSRHQWRSSRGEQ